MKNILLIVGSQREKSFNKMVAAYIEKQLEEKAQVSYLDYSKIPFFNQDTEFPTPLEVQEMRDIVGDHEAIWIISPEYNGSIPGPLKNALDWISRPLGKGQSGRPNIIKEKPVALSSAGARGGSGVLPQLMALMGKMALSPMEETVGIVLPNVSFVTGEFALEEGQKEDLKNQVQNFLDYIG